MTKDHVLELLGEPVGKSGKEEGTWSGKGKSDPTRAAAAGIAGAIFSVPEEYWEYNSIDASKLTEEKIADYMIKGLFNPLDESFVVYFDQDGKVKKLRLPLGR